MRDSNIFGCDFDDEIAREKEAEVARRAASDLTPAKVDALTLAARQEGREAGLREGHAAGLEAARGEIGAATASLLEGLGPQIAQLLEDSAAHRKSLETDMVSFVAGVIEKAVPEILFGYNEARIDAEIRAICRRAQGSRKLEIRVSDALREHAEGAVRSCLGAEGETVDLRVVSDPSLGETEIRASWTGGASDYSHARLCEGILDVLRRDIATRQKNEGQPE